ncbi:MAG: pyruvate kinase [Candidatus Gracilibacteria bacterium]|nr:pyruvate kinase [Candidatus Gracilibacteria bacterium]
MKTKIIATIGPACCDYYTLKRMSAAGVSIFRINTKYNTHEFYEGILEHLKKLGGCKVLFDIKGAKKIPWLKTLDFDYLAVSFSETASQIASVRKELDKKNVKIIAKIENEKGFQNIDQLIKASDGIMVARGDLGKNTPIEKVPIKQKLIIKKCATAKKFDITATEMLLSMVSNRTPERAEVSDVANAVLDGSDAVMLSEETAVGKYPVLVVETMAKIIQETEKSAKLVKSC